MNGWFKCGTNFTSVSMECLSHLVRASIRRGQSLYFAILSNSQNSPPESSAAAGNVNTQAAAILRIVDICKPLLFAIIVPATPELSTWVVDTGKPNLSAARIDRKNVVY